MFQSRENKGVKRGVGAEEDKSTSMLQQIREMFKEENRTLVSAFETRFQAEHGRLPNGSDVRDELVPYHISAAYREYRALKRS